MKRIFFGMTTATVAVLAAALALSACANFSPRSNDSTLPVRGADSSAPYIWSQSMEHQKRTMQQAALGSAVQVSQTDDNRLKLDFPIDFSFDTNRADIKASVRPLLDRFAGALKLDPATTLDIIGHTDHRGDAALNEALALERAAHVRDYLGMRGVAPNRIAVHGSAAGAPFAPNEDDDGRARNRRVEIYVTPAAPR